MAQPGPEDGLKITSLPDDVLVAIFKLLGTDSIAPVCKAFRRVYHENATTVKLTHAYDPQLDAPLARSLQRCNMLRHVDATALIQQSWLHKSWPTARLTHIHSLSVNVGGWPPREIPLSLRTLVVHGECDARSAAWVSALLGHLHAAASKCAVHVESVVDTSLWLQWKRSRIAASTIFVSKLPEASDSLARANLSRLEHLTVASCAELQRFPGFPGARLSNLTNLRLVNCPSLASLDEFHGAPLSRLHFLALDTLPRLQSLQPLRTWGVTQLEYLELWRCHALTDLSSLADSRLPNLSKLRVFDCTALTSLDALKPRHAPQLREISLYSCPALGALPTSLPWPNLEKISCIEVGLRDLHCLSLASLTALTRLALVNCPLTSLQGLDSADLPALRVLDLSSSRDLRTLSPLGGCRLPSLLELHVSRCVALRDVEGLHGGGLGALTQLNLSYCEALVSLEGLLTAGLEQLCTLDLDCCTSLARLHGVGGLPNLRELRVAECSCASDVRSLNQLPHLRTLGRRHNGPTTAHFMGRR